MFLSRRQYSYVWLALRLEDCYCDAVVTYSQQSKGYRLNGGHTERQLKEERSGGQDMLKVVLSCLTVL